MCSRLEESGVRARPGTSGMGGTLPRGDRSVPFSLPEIGRAGLHGTTKTGTTREQRARALIKPTSKPGRGDAFGTRRETVH